MRPLLQAERSGNRLEDFKLERFFAKHEFAAKFLLASSDSQSMTVEDLLQLVARKHDVPTSQLYEEFGKVWCGYTETWGNPALRETIASSLYHGGRNISPESILVHSGAEEAIFTVCTAILSPGDEVIVQVPAYQSSVSVPEYIGAAVKEWRTHWDPVARRWSLRIEELVQLISPKVKLIFFNSPHNPTGYQLPLKDFQRVAEIAGSHGIYVLSDEVYRFLEYHDKDRDSRGQETVGPDDALTLPGICEIYEKGISLGVMSKTFGLPGLRIGWIASQDKGLLAQVAAVKDYTTICNSAPSEFLALKALQAWKDIRERNKSIVLDNRVHLRAFMKKHESLFGWQEESAAGCLSFVEAKGPLLDANGSCDTFCNFLVEETGVLLLPGSCYGSAYQKFFRMGFGRSNFKEGLQVLDRYLEEKALK